MVKKQPRRATVWWGDAHGGSQSFDSAEVETQHKPFLVGTTGWVVISDRVGVTVAMEFRSPIANTHLPDADDCRTRVFVPRGMVQRIEWLK